MKGFSGSIWHALYIVLPLGLIVFFWAFFSLEKGSAYFFDPKDGGGSLSGDFEAHSKRYQDIAKLLITLSVASIAFVISLVTSDRQYTSPVAQRLQVVAPIVLGFFGVCVAFLITFITMQTYLYEQYCHAQNRDTYTRWKYALNVSFGWTGLLSGILGFWWLASNLWV